MSDNREEALAEALAAIERVFPPTRKAPDWMVRRAPWDRVGFDPGTSPSR